jgi:hypothetical protein
MAPTPRARGEREHPKEEAAAATTGLRIKSVCPEGKVPVVKIFPTKVEKGNPLLGPDPRQEILKLEGAARAEFIRRHVRSFEEVYKRAKPEREGELLNDRRSKHPQPDWPPRQLACKWRGRS